MTDRLYAKDHEYIMVDGDVGTVGISVFAQEQLGDVVFIELPEVGKSLKKGDEGAVVESVKAASEVYAPVDGEVTEVNAAITATPATVNEDPLGAGWFFKMRIADKGQLKELMSEDEYKAFVEG